MAEPQGNEEQSDWSSQRTEIYVNVEDLFVDQSHLQPSDEDDAPLSSLCVGALPLPHRRALDIEDVFLASATPETPQDLNRNYPRLRMPKEPRLVGWLTDIRAFLVKDAQTGQAASRHC